MTESAEAEGGIDLWLTGVKGIQQESVVSIRIGSTRRQATFDTTVPYRFPGVQGRQHMKIDIYERVAHARLLLEPDEAHWSVPLESSESACFTQCQGEEKRLEFKVACGSSDSLKRSEARSSDALSKKSLRQDVQPYLDKHGITMTMQALLQAIIKERPADPHRYMIGMLQNSRANCLAGGRPRPQTAQACGRAESLPQHRSACTGGSTVRGSAPISALVSVGEASPQGSCAMTQPPTSMRSNPDSLRYETSPATRVMRAASPAAAPQLFCGAPPQLGGSSRRSESEGRVGTGKSQGSFSPHPGSEASQDWGDTGALTHQPGAAAGSARALVSMARSGSLGSLQDLGNHYQDQALPIASAACASASASASGPSGLGLHFGFGPSGFGPSGFGMQHPSFVPNCRARPGSAAPARYREAAKRRVLLASEANRGQQRIQEGRPSSASSIPDDVDNCELMRILDMQNSGFLMMKSLPVTEEERHGPLHSLPSWSPSSPAGSAQGTSVVEAAAISLDGTLRPLFERGGSGDDFDEDELEGVHDEGIIAGPCQAEEASCSSSSEAASSGFAPRRTRGSAGNIAPALTPLLEHGSLTPANSSQAGGSSAKVEAALPSRETETQALLVEVAASTASPDPSPAASAPALGPYAAAATAAAEPAPAPVPAPAPAPASPHTPAATPAQPGPAPAPELAPAPTAPPAPAPEHAPAPAQPVPPAPPAPAQAPSAPAPIPAQAAEAPETATAETATAETGAAAAAAAAVAATVPQPTTTATENAPKLAPDPTAPPSAHDCPAACTLPPTQGSTGNGSAPGVDEPEANQLTAGADDPSYSNEPSPEPVPFHEEHKSEAVGSEPETAAVAVDAVATSAATVAAAAAVAATAAKAGPEAPTAAVGMSGSAVAGEVEAGVAAEPQPNPLSQPESQPASQPQRHHAAAPTAATEAPSRTEVSQAAPTAASEAEATAMATTDEVAEAVPTPSEPAPGSQASEPPLPPRSEPEDSPPCPCEAPPMLELQEEANRGSTASSPTDAPQDEQDDGGHEAEQRCLGQLQHKATLERLSTLGSSELQSELKEANPISCFPHSIRFLAERPRLATAPKSEAKTGMKVTTSLPSPESSSAGFGGDGEACSPPHGADAGSGAADAAAAVAAGEALPLEPRRRSSRRQTFDCPGPKSLERDEVKAEKEEPAAASAAVKEPTSSPLPDDAPASAETQPAESAGGATSSSCAPTRGADDNPGIASAPVTCSDAAGTLAEGESVKPTTCAEPEVSSPETAKAKLKLDGVELQSLQSKPSLESSFRAEVAQCVAEHLGAILKSEQVSVHLSAGSVVLHIEAQVPSNSTQKALETSLRGRSVQGTLLREALIERISALDGLLEVSSGDLVLTDLSCPELTSVGIQPSQDQQEVVPALCTPSSAVLWTPQSPGTPAALGLSSEAVLGLPASPAAATVGVAGSEASSRPPGQPAPPLQTSSPMTFRLTDPHGLPLGIRSAPDEQAPRTGKVLYPGDEFVAVEVCSEGSAQQFLRLQDGRGWVFMQNPKDGRQLLERVGDQQVPSCPVLPKLPSPLSMEASDIASAASTARTGEAVGNWRFAFNGAPPASAPTASLLVESAALAASMHGGDRAGSKARLSSSPDEIATVAESLVPVPLALPSTWMPAGEEPLTPHSQPSESTALEVAVLVRERSRGGS